MTETASKRWKKVKEVLNQALQLDAVERRSFLEQACGHDKSVLREVESLLSHDGKADHAGFLRQPPRDQTRSLLSEVNDRLRRSDLVSPSERQELPLPIQIDRYQVERQIGRGAFGVVMLAHDPKLDRKVAIKLQRFQRLASVSSIDVEREARILAQLDHPHIVPVYDTGQLEDGRSYVVSKFVEGRDLSVVIDDRELSAAASARLVASIADALQQAHGKKLIHRDVKPSNILIDGNDTPYLTDFGLTLSDEEFGNASSQGYTPAYASPEQAAGEGHRVDGRSDIFSLGVVFYQLLTGERPFSGRSSRELLERIRKFAPRPPRQLDPSIPEELERICMKALARQKCDRYMTAHDMASDLRYFLTQQRFGDAPLTNEDRGSRPEGPKVTVVYKGLRSFDADDAEFFLRLLPGTRNRDGLPESVDFWKKWFEETNAEEAHSIGVIYGPSGCGKSSFVKAGLVPRLADHLSAVYVESLSDGMEDRIARQLAHQFQVDPTRGLAAQMTELRRSKSNTKIVLVLDQFEQWLHAHPNPDASELVQALRQCDGCHVQCVVIVRDDLWMAVTEFMRVLDVPLTEGRNATAVEQFRPNHARHVLSEFGRAFGDLPAGDLSATHEQFLKAATNQLAENGKIVCVRLVLFAQMIQGKPWTPRTLEQAGGAAGLGVDFLDETFSSPSCPLGYRRHERAVRSVLEALSPESRLELKGRSLSTDELREVSGYGHRDHDFSELVDILDAQTRLITPTESPDRDSDARHYHLTHDYLVPSIRQWLTRKQSETRRGRAELCLRERAVQFQRSPEARYLPSPLEYLSIQARVPSRSRKSEEKQVMRVASTRYGALATLLLLLAALTAWGVWEFVGRSKAEGIVASIASADIHELPRVIEPLPRYRRWAQQDLFNMAVDSASRKQQLNASLALLSLDAASEVLDHRLLLDCTLTEFPIVLDRLKPYQRDMSQSLWDEFRRGSDSQSRLNAGMALAAFDPDHANWAEDDYRFLVTQLLESLPEDQQKIRDCLRPIADHLSPLLQEAFSNTANGATTKNSAAYALGDFHSDDASFVLQLASIATPEQFAILYFGLASDAIQSEKGHAILQSIVDEQPTAMLSERERVALGKRRAGAAVTLLRLGKMETALKMFAFTDDPEALTQFIHRQKDRGVTLDDLVRFLDFAERKEDQLARFAILLAMGEFDVDDLTESQQMAPLIKKLARAYAEEGDSAIHSAIGWLLRRWGFSEELRRVDQTPISYDPTGKRDWFVQKAGEDFFTFVVFHPGQFEMGPTQHESGRRANEGLASVQLSRAFAMTDREVTLDQFSRHITPPNVTLVSQEENSPVVAVSWFQAVYYCSKLTECTEGMTDESQCYGTSAEIEALPFPPGPEDLQCEFDRRGLRLPTEAEWEYACLAGTRTAYGFGNDRDLLARYAWQVLNANQLPHRVGLLRPNRRGLFDMHGNAFEWCNCWYDHASPPSGLDPSGPETGRLRSIRGGGWYSFGNGCRSASRLAHSPSQHAPQNGFRLVMTLAESSR